MSPNKRAPVSPSERGQQVNSDAISTASSAADSDSDYEHMSSSVSDTRRNQSSPQNLDVGTTTLAQPNTALEISGSANPSTSSARKGKARTNAASENNDGNIPIVPSATSSPKAAGGTEDTRKGLKKGYEPAVSPPPKTPRKSPPTGKEVESAPTATGKGSPKTPVLQSSSQVNFDNMLDAFGQMSISRSTFRRSAVDGSPVAVGPGFSPDGDKYRSTKGNVFDTSDAPPQPCFNCGGRHWRKDLEIALRGDGLPRNANHKRALGRKATRVIAHSVYKKLKLLDPTAPAASCDSPDASPTKQPTRLRRPAAFKCQQNHAVDFEPVLTRLSLFDIEGIEQGVARAALVLSQPQRVTVTRTLVRSLISGVLPTMAGNGSAHLMGANAVAGLVAESVSVSSALAAGHSASKVRLVINYNRLEHPNERIVSHLNAVFPNVRSIVVQCNFGAGYLSKLFPSAAAGRYTIEPPELPVILPNVTSFTVTMGIGSVNMLAFLALLSSIFTSFPSLHTLSADNLFDDLWAVLPNMLSDWADHPTFPSLRTLTMNLNTRGAMFPGLETLE
ncbi:hypothetical protein M427DRAFT_72261 [Gonapodya prolifera JEL478]|uniref:Uncharacterized protein n=1 Tax=Gonapodya prolifera (strain JEL478) TaxID=1344416 RepID=A0A139A732_GONPJ|nr:hypothetical protein M427DRAFT_72261 [Gonapodya prolifera JEL478]|eukprot:KXS12153.1 hypothetical protein M427DRAFT_72261 [Gonapodya prolifera JEL478]